MRLTPYSYNGFLFQQTGKVSTDWDVPYSWNVAGISSTNTQRSQNFPQYAVKNYSGAIKVVSVAMTECIDDSRDALIKALDVLGSEQHPLFALDELGREWYVNAICNVPMSVQAVDELTLSAGVVFEVDDPIFKKYVPSEQTINVNGTGSGTLRPVGNQPALPIITITPLSAGAYGFTYQRFIQIINNSPNALTMYPLNLTGAGLDTAALVSGGKMLSNGDDLRIYVDGVEVKRWLQDMNTANTKIWINWTQPANSNMTLGATIAGTGDVTTITIENTAGNVALLPNIPLSGNVKIGSEIFVYTGVDVTNRQLTGCTRAERQTSAGAHSTGDTIYFVTHDVWLYYGSPSIAPYVVDDTYKPIISLDSTNTSWIFEEFSSISGLRTGSWTIATQYNLLAPSRVYTGPQNTLADPATVAGAAIVNAPYGRFETIELQLYNPCGFSEITDATGQKYSTWVVPDGYLGLNKSVEGAGGNLQGVWVESAPSPLSTWVALDSHSSVDLTGAYIFYNIFLVNADLGNTPAHSTYYEFDDVTVGLISAQVPTINIAAEASEIHLHSVFDNAATGDQMTIDLVMVAGTYLVVNTKEKTITLFDGTNQINSLIDMPVRAEWFQFLPGEDNDITITDSGIVSYDFSWEDRSL